MRVLWLIRRKPYLGVQYDSEFYKAFEEIIGKDNIVFYGASNLPKVDNSGIPFYPENYKSFDKYRSDPNSLVSLSKLVEEEKPDIVVLNDVRDMLSFDMSLPSGTNTVRIAILEDAHYEWYRDCIPFLDKKELDMIFTRTYGNGIAYRIKQRCPVGYFPWSISSTMFYDKCLNKTNDIYLSGVVCHTYPIRIFLHYLFFGNLVDATGSCKHFEYNGMSGFADGKTFNYSQYLGAINQSKVVVFDGSLFKVPIIKYFEVMASNSLVLADLPCDYKALRFEPNENMVEINLENVS